MLQETLAGQHWTPRGETDAQLARTQSAVSSSYIAGQQLPLPESLPASYGAAGASPNLVAQQHLLSQSTEKQAHAQLVAALHGIVQARHRGHLEGPAALSAAATAGAAAQVPGTQSYLGYGNEDVALAPPMQQAEKLQLLQKLRQQLLHPGSVAAGAAAAAPDAQQPAGAPGPMPRLAPMQLDQQLDGALEAALAAYVARLKANGELARATSSLSGNQAGKVARQGSELRGLLKLPAGSSAPSLVEESQTQGRLGGSSTLSSVDRLDRLNSSLSSVMSQLAWLMPQASASGRPPVPAFSDGTPSLSTLQPSKAALGVISRHASRHEGKPAPAADVGAPSAGPCALPGTPSTLAAAAPQQLCPVASISSEDRATPRAAHASSATAMHALLLQQLLENVRSMPNLPVGPAGVSSSDTQGTCGQEMTRPEAVQAQPLPFNLMTFRRLLADVYSTHVEVRCHLGTRDWHYRGAALLIIVKVVNEACIGRLQTTGLGGGLYCVFP